MTIDWNLLSAEQRATLAAVREAAGSIRCTPWLVGGAVRDLLLGRAIGDLDVTIEGDAERFAKRLAEGLHGSLTRFERFLTFRIDTPLSSLPIDVVTARHETYARPGALPDVQPGTMEDDLLRRDFAANAIALNLQSGTLFDPAEGLRDIESRRLRVLHEQSFIDDPTRIFRGVRLSHRLSFAFDPATAALAREAIRAGVLAHVSRERLWREVDLALAEASAGAIVTELAECGALTRIVGHLPRLPEPEAIDRAFVLARAAGVSSRAMLLALVGGGSREALQHAGLSQRDAAAVETARDDAAKVRRTFARTVAPLRRASALERTSAVAIALAAAADGEIAALAAAWFAARHLHVAVRSDDLALGGTERRHIGRAVRSARVAVAAGTIKPEQSAAFARSRLIQYLRRSRPE